MQTLVAVIGLQFGDEGKGKIVDKIVAEAQKNNKTVVVRFQGGTNAGHTIYAKDKDNNLVEFITHAAPTGLATNADIAIGPSVAFDPERFVEELTKARELFNYTGRIMISERTGMLLDYHRKLDAWKETKAKNIGTTKSGIGPFYKDNADRLTRITFYDYVSEHFPEKLKEVLEMKKSDLLGAKITEDIDAYHKELLTAHEKIRKELKQYIEILEYRMREYLDKGYNIIIEGAQGTNLDNDMGTIPDVTSSHLLAPHAFPTLGLPRKLFKIIGIEKIYPTRVGNGKLPTLEEDVFGPKVVKNAGEFGATTGRERRVGYPDWALVKRSVMLNDCDGIIMTRTDCLQNMDIKAGIGYVIKGEKTEELPLDLSLIEKPIFLDKTFSWILWKGHEDLSNPLEMDALLKEQRTNYVKNGFDSLPEGLKDYVKEHDKFVGCPIIGISLGPGRDETVDIK